jgi:hypothetical protein
MAYLQIEEQDGAAGWVPVEQGFSNATITQIRAALPSYAVQRRARALLDGKVVAICRPAPPALSLSPSNWLQSRLRPRLYEGG